MVFPASAVTVATIMAVALNAVKPLGFLSAPAFLCGKSNLRLSHLGGAAFVLNPVFVSLGGPDVCSSGNPGGHSADCARQSPARLAGRAGDGAVVGNRADVHGNDFARRVYERGYRDNGD